MLSDALIFLISTACGLFAVTLLLRFYLQWARAGYRNPVSQFVNALTDFMVRPARRVIPGLWGLDLASPILAWLIQFAALMLIAQIKGVGPGSDMDAGLLVLALLAVIMLVKLGLYMVMIVVIVQALLSLINPYSPLRLSQRAGAPVLRRLSADTTLALDLSRCSLVMCQCCDGSRRYFEKALLPAVSRSAAWCRYDPKSGKSFSACTCSLNAREMTCWSAAAPSDSPRSPGGRQQGQCRVGRVSARSTRSPALADSDPAWCPRSSQAGGDRRRTGFLAGVVAAPGARRSTPPGRLRPEPHAIP